MADGFDFVMDLIIVLCKGIWFSFFFRGLTGKGVVFHKWRNAAAVIAAVQYMVIHMLFWWLTPLKQFLYGDDMQAMDMRQSIPLHLLFMGTSLLCVWIVYRERLQILLYLTATFYAFEEMTRFILYALWDGTLTILLGNLNRAYEQQRIPLVWYAGVVQAIVFIWPLFINLVFLAVQGWICHIYCKELYGRNTLPDRQELHFLIIPSIIGLGLGILLRGTMFKMEGAEVFNLLEVNPELRLVIPLMAGLCIISMLRSLTVLHKLEKAYEEKAGLQVYRQRAEDMEEHIQDMGHLYDSIRDVKHDIKNYAADLALLLQSCDVPEKETREEMQEYLDGLSHSMERLDMQYATGNAVTDVVVNRHFREAQNKGIRTECDFICPRSMGIHAFDLAVMLHNALENAIEACEKEKLAERYIRLAGEQKGNFLVMKVENTFTGVIKEPANREAGKVLLPVSSKQDVQNHGIGMRNIEKYAQKYAGTLQWEVKRGLFQLTIMLQKKGS